LILDEEWTIEKKRRVLATILPLYRKRGTLLGIEQMLRIYLDVDTSSESQSLVKNVIVTDTFIPAPAPIRVGSYTVRSDYRAGDPVVDGIFPYAFIAEITLKKTNDPQQIIEVRRLARDIIEKAKPAHCTFLLEIKIPTFAVGSVQVGENSLLGNVPDETRAGISQTGTSERSG
jgi:hypothetical protein